ncbi:MAG: hypothetical protein ACTTKO_09525 [Candidatus Limimorpha sp.]
MKKLFIPYLSVLLACCSCQHDPSYHEEYYVLNKLPYAVRVCTNHHPISLTDSIITTVVEPDNEVLFIDSHKSAYGNSGNDEFYEWICEQHFVMFNDSIKIQYDTSTVGFDKTMWKKSCWELMYYNGKPRNTHYKLRYTIDEQDYQNALKQCGYGKKQEILLP